MVVEDHQDYLEIPVSEIVSFMKERKEEFDRAKRRNRIEDAGLLREGMIIITMFMDENQGFVFTRYLNKKFHDLYYK